MARGILEMREIPTNLREWDQFLRNINALIQINNAPPGLVFDISPGSVPIAAIENIGSAILLGRPSGGVGPVQQISAAVAAVIIQSSIDHGSIAGLGDNDHPQYVRKSILTTDGDLFILAGGEVDRIPSSTFALAADVESGTYTPTRTHVANVATSAGFLAQYTRVGAVVSVSGKIDVTATAGATLTQIGLSLPVPSNFATQQECAGTAAAPAVAQYGAIDADAANNRAQLNFISADTTSRTMMFQFSYRVIA